MNKVKLWIPVLVGLMVGQLFAEGANPFTVANTVRVGYNDNFYYSSTNEKQSSFVTDTIDLSYRAALSDRTDMTVKSQINLLTDTGGNELYPNLYALLSHSVTPRLLLRLSEYYRSGDKAGSGTTATAANNTRYNYFVNSVDASADYVLTGKDRLGASLSHEILRNDKEIDTLDYTTVGAGVFWKKELSPQRTYATLKLNRSRLDYDNLPRDTQYPIGGATNKISYLDARAYYSQTDLSVELSQTFNQQWQGHVEAGASYVEPNFSDSWSEVGNLINSSIAKTTNRVDNSSQLKPKLSAGLVYLPSPRTRLTGDFSLAHKPSDNSGYGGQDTAEVRFSAQHDITAKLKASAMARFANTKYDTQNATTATSEKETEDRVGLELRFTYRLNRINSLDLDLAHNEASRNIGDDWKQDTVSVGWRVEL